MADAKRDENFVTTLLAVSNADGVTPVAVWADPVTHRILTDLAGGGSGTVTTVSVVSANGFAGTVATATSTPAITLSTTITGILSGNGTAISAASTTGSGAVVLANTPTLITPVLGAATGTSLQLSGLTASEIVITDASKNLASAAVATYPSLTELTYLKGVTSAIQTQINAKGAGTVTAVSSANADIGVATGTTTPVLTLNSATLPTASTIVKRDASANTYSNNYFANTASTVSAGGTTVLTVASARTQNLTGSSAQTFQLPDATTLALSSIFEFNNNSSASLTITNAGAASQYVVPAGGAVLCFCTSIGSANGTWDFHAQAPASATWGSGVVGLVMNSVLTTSPSVGSGASTSTAPSFIPQRGASTTGFGGDGTSLFATIAGAIAATFSAARSIFPIVETTGVFELGHASDTTISRVSAGVAAIEGKNILTTDGGTLTGNLILGENTSIDLDPAGSADGKYSGICITGTAGAALAFGDLIYLAVADSRWELTDADATATAGTPLIGMCVLAAAGDGSATKILLQGQIRADAKFPALTIGAPAYVGETAGAIQTAIPTGADNVIRVVGRALTADELYFCPSQDHQITVA